MVTPRQQYAALCGSTKAQLLVLMGDSEGLRLLKGSLKGDTGIYCKSVTSQRVYTNPDVIFFL